MKIKEFAICMSGQPRCIIPAHYDFKKLFNGLEYDVFSHIWDSQELLSSWGHNMGFENKKTNVHNPKEFVDLYEPKNYEVENYKNTIFYNNTVNFEGYRNPTNKTWSSYSQFYSIMKSFDILQEYCVNNDTKYKYVVKYRMDHDVDFEFSKLFTDKEISQEWQQIKNRLNANQNLIITNPGYDWPNGNGVSNLLAIGNFDAMVKYSRVYDYYPWLLQNCRFPEYDEANLKLYLQQICKFEIENCSINVGVYR
jgi:hypothetical protein